MPSVCAAVQVASWHLSAVQNVVWGAHMESEQPDEEAFEIAIVDDDPLVLAALARTVAMIGCRATTYASASQYLAFADHDRPHCVLLDVFLPELDGLEVQRRLAARAEPPPIIFMSGQADVPTCAVAMKAGALEFLVKPIRAHELLAAIQRARLFALDGRQRREELAALRARHDALSSRERRVMALVVEGYLNKQIAGVIGLSEPSVKLYRAAVMRKMGADSSASLVRMAVLLEEPLARRGD